jgi:transmembrane sensor
MSASSTQLRRARAAEEAAEWVTRLDSGPLSPSERNEFLNWLRESPLHVSEMLQISRISSALSKFGQWNWLAPPGEVSRTSPAHNGVPHSATPVPHQRATRSLRPLSALAASLTILVGVMTLHQPLSGNNLHTQIGERRQITLADGSVVQMSSNTDLQIRLEPTRRSVTLQRGEASFRVAKDPSRPFIVDASAAQVQAVGTMFTVARSTESVVVTVTEGRVSVTPADAGDSVTPGGTSAARVSLTANERIVVSSRGVVSPVRRVENDPLIEWGDNRLAFDRVSVADVVKQFNRRNTVQIRLSDTSLGSRTISGVFYTRDPQSFVDVLQSVVGTTSSHNGDEIVVTIGTAGAGPAVPTR